MHILSGPSETAPLDLETLGLTQKPGRALWSNFMSTWVTIKALLAQRLDPTLITNPPMINHKILTTLKKSG